MLLGYVQEANADADASLRHLVGLLLALAALLGLSGAMMACGGQGKRRESAAGVVPESVVRAPGDDHDGDADNKSNRTYDGDDGIRYGRAADREETGRIAALVKGYYVALAADEGQAGCSLLARSLAGALAALEAGQAGGSDGGRGGCAQGFVKRFRQGVLGRRGSAVTAVELLAVRIGGDRGLAFLRLPSAEIRTMPVVREQGQWKVQALIDEMVG